MNKKFRLLIIVFTLLIIIFYRKELFTVSSTVVSKNTIQAFVVSTKVKIVSRARAGDFNVYTVKFKTINQQEFTYIFEDSLLKGLAPTKGEWFWFERVNWDTGKSRYVVLKNKIEERFMFGRQFVSQ